MASGHPTDEMLASYVAGASSAGMAVLVAAHLTYCPDCRRRVSALEAVSAAAFAGAEPEATDEGTLDAVLRRLDTQASAGEQGLRGIADAVLPGPVASALGMGFDEIRWRFRMPGVSECVIDLGGTERVSLLRVRPGAGVPSHTHTADEATLVLKGTLCDGDRQYGRGAVALATPEDDHHPHAGEGEDCICLTVLEGGVRFTGRFGRALNLFAE
jgi:putative transcriptional regulator